MCKIIVGVMVNAVLYVLPPLRNERRSVFGVDIVCNLISLTVFLPVDSIYCSCFKKNYSFCMVAITINFQGWRS